MLLWLLILFPAKAFDSDHWDDQLLVIIPVMERYRSSTLHAGRLK
jgi:hypothetical protein